MTEAGGSELERDWKMLCCGFEDGGQDHRLRNAGGLQEPFLKSKETDSS